MRGAWRTPLIALFVAGCSSLAVKDSAPPAPPDLSGIPDAEPRIEPPSRYGNNPVYTVNGETYRVLETSRGYRERGVASWYGTKFHGQRTSSGEPYDMYAMTAAHKTLPLPSYVRVTNLQNDRSIVVRVNDRGPFHDDRLIDLSYVAALKLDIAAAGTGLVEVTAIHPDSEPEPAPRVVRSEPPRVYVQLGAYAQPENAERIASRLQSHGFEPRITRAQSGSATLHRVRLGPMPSVEAADDLVRRLLRLGFTQRHVVVD